MADKNCTIASDQFQLIFAYQFASVECGEIVKKYRKKTVTGSTLFEGHNIFVCNPNANMVIIHFIRVRLYNNLYKNWKLSCDDCPSDFMPLFSGFI
jgi:hypothetical protein